MENIAKELKKVGGKLVDLMRKIIIAQRHNASGTLINSFRNKVTKEKTIIELKIINKTDYWEKVNNYSKTKQSVVVDYKTIKSWMNDKKDEFSHLSDKEKESWAKSIAYRLTAKGYPTRGGANVPVKSTEYGTERYGFIEKADKIAEELGYYKDIDKSIDKEIDEQLKLFGDEGSTMSIIVG
jgi:hypothetical protein